MDNGKTLYVRLAAHLGDLQGGLAKGSAMISAYGAKADAQMAKLENYAKNNQKELRSLGNAAGGVGLAAAVGIGLAIRKYAEFDKQMSAVRAATHATEDEMSALRAEAIKLGADTQFSATEAAEGIEELAKAGISTADILGGGLKGALDLAAAGGLGVGQSAEIAATALTQFNLKGKDIPHLADLLAAGAGKAQGSVTDLGAALGQTGLVASNMGLSIEDTTGSLAAFASAGLIGSDSGTAFKTMIQRLQAPMGRGAKALDKYGISAYDAQGNFVGITDVAGQLQSKLAGLTQQQRDAALAQIFGSDAIRAATVLYKQGATGMQKWIDKTNDAGYAAETARLRTDNLSGDIERLGGSLDSLFIGMGSGANGPMRELVQMLESVVDVAGALPDPVLQAAVAGLALTAALGLTVFAATRMVGAVGSTRASLALLNTQARSAATGLLQMDKALLMKNAGRGAALMGGLALASGSAGDAFGLSNTAGLALMGTMGGPLGVAAGTAVGFIMDVASASDKMGQSFEDAQASLGGQTTFAGQTKALEKLKKSMVDYDYQTDHSLSAVKDRFDSFFGGTTLGEEQERDLQKATRAVQDYQSSIQLLEDRTVGAKDGVNELFDPARMQEFADQVKPVLEKAGLDMQEVLSAGPQGEHWGEAVAAIEEYRAATDTAAGRQDALKGALVGVDDAMFSTSQSASDLAKALQGLLSPEMDQDAAMIAWRENLRELRKELSEGGRSLKDHSEDADKNRTAVMGQVDALTKILTTSAKAGESSDQLATRLKNGRQAIIDAGVAAGFNAGEMSKLLDQYGLTPELVATLVKADGVDKAKEDLKGVGAAADEVGKKKPKPTVTVGGLTGALGAISKILSDLNLIDGKVATSAIHINKTVYDHGTTIDAYGSFRPGAGPGNAIVPRYARGHLTPAHIVRAGVPRGMYGEPETQGEAYIPFAKDRRKRSLEITGQVAARFGYDLSPRGMSAARGNTVVVQQAGRGPLIGSVTLGAGPRREVRAGLDELEKTLRKIERGGRPW